MLVDSYLYLGGAQEALSLINLQASKIASTVRKVVKETLRSDELENNFKDIEDAMEAFPQDGNIYNTSLNLIVSMLLAIEKAIEFFTKHQYDRAKSVLIKNEKYEDALVESINQIKIDSEKLMKSMNKSHMIGNRKGMVTLIQGQTRITVQIDALKEQNESNSAFLYNSIKDLLDEAETKINRIEELIRERTPSPSPSVMLLGPLQPPTQAQGIPLPWYPQAYTQQYPYYMYPPYMCPPQQSPSWYPQAIAQVQPSASPNSARLQEVLYIPYSDDKDVKQVSNENDVISLRHRVRAEQVVSTSKFRDWAIKAESKELLVEGDFGYDNCYYISALSLLCATLTQALRTREGYISTVFFCGCHGKDDDQYNNGKDVGGVAIMKSMILQLLKQHHSFDLTGLEKDIRLDLLKDGDIDQLCGLFVWLVKRLPRDLILVCIIDGAVHFEIDIFEDGLQKVIKCLLSLSKDNTVPIPVKVLVTSPVQTEITGNLFREERDDDDSRFISLESFPEINYISAAIESDREMNEQLDAYESDD
ncbi:hypothetical protein J3E69DRAFT_126399 [Trichoderma sp. SZMC 28015]